MGESEIARLRRLIDQEIQAMKQGFSGYAITSRHDIIDHKYQQLGNYHEQLERLIGEKEAGKMVIGAYIQIMDQGILDVLER